MKLIIDIPKDVYTRLFDNEIALDDVCEMARALRLGIPHETVTEFADRCRECGAKYGKLLEQEPKTGHWIPVSERLPEKEGRYLTTIVNEYDNRLRYIMTCDYFPNNRWCPDDECASSNVVAWLPLPKPYEPQESEVNNG